jgi:hypothetical protein
VGTRIEFYAVDIPPFQQFLDTSLADALRFAARRGSQRFPLWFHTDSGRYLASPDYGILFDDRQGRGQGYAHPTETELEVDPCLAISCQRHLTLGDTAQLGTLFRVLADSDATPWVQELSRGTYWWWICSLLDGIQHSDALDTSDREHYEAQFMRVLRSVGAARRCLDPRSREICPIFQSFRSGRTNTGRWASGQQRTLSYSCSVPIACWHPGFRSASQQTWKSFASPIGMNGYMTCSGIFLRLGGWAMPGQTWSVSSGSGCCTRPAAVTINWRLSLPQEWQMPSVCATGIHHQARRQDHLLCIGLYIAYTTLSE